MTPDEFWSATMDEVELMVKGQVDKWRIERRSAYMIVLSAGTLKYPSSITEMFPLPYDDELPDEGDQVLSGNAAEDFYNAAKANWN